MEEKKVSPEATPEVKPEPKDTGTKSAEERIKELTDKNATLEKDNTNLTKRAGDQESMIGRQSTEIGDLRKIKPEEPSKETQDELEKELVEDLKKQGYTEETAKENAKLLRTSGLKIFNRELNRRVGIEAKELVEEVFDDPKDGRMDKAIFKENEADIMAELDRRKLAPTARGNFRIFRDCYNDVVRRKADTLKAEQKPKDEEKRDAMIAEGTQPPPGATEKVATNEEKEYLKSIPNAGGMDDEKRESGLFR